jgi:branched-chain amino acid transport system substrate-binding protein
MKKLIVHGIFAVGLALLLLSAAEAWAADGPAPIKIGEINSYTGPAAVFTASYRRGFDMAVDEVNKAGGVLGRPLSR